MLPHDVGYSDPATAHPAPGAPRGPAPAPPGLSSAPDVWALLGALRRQWIAAVLIGGSLAAVAAVATFALLTPQASAYTKIKVRFFEPVLWATNVAPTDFKTFQRTTAAEVQSREVIKTALRDEEVRKLGLESQFPDSAQFIEDGLKVEFNENSEMLTVLFSGADPNQSLVIAKAVRDAFFRRIVDPRKKERDQRVKKLEDLYYATQDSLKKKKDNLPTLITALKDADPGWRESRQEIILRINYLQQHLGKVTLERIKGEDNLALLKARIAAAKARLEKAASRKTKPAEPAPGKAEPSTAELELLIDRAVATDARAKTLQAQLSLAEEKADDWDRKGFRYDHYPFRVARAQVARYKKQLNERRAELAAKVREAEETKPAVASRTGPGAPAAIAQEDPEIYLPHLDKQIKNLKDEEERLKTEIADLRKQASKVPAAASDYEREVGEIKRQEELIASIYSKVEREKLERDAAPRIAPFGDPQLLKADNKKQYVASLAAPLGVLFAVCAGLAWLECRKQRVRGAGEVSRGLGIRVVGAVPAQAGLERRLVGPAGESDLEGTPAMESIDAIRTRLLHEADTRSTRVVMVTSAGAGEGKTTLAAALASSLARAGRKTLLLDGDLRRPGVHQLFEAAPQPGFSEALLGEVELLEAIQDTPLENLSVMAAGQWDREVLACLARGGLESMFDKLAEEFDFILIDSHPVLEAADALLIGRQADAVLLSVLNEVSQMPRVYAAQQQLASVGIRLMGAVVNAADPEDALTAPPAHAAVA